jgi:hypothetical protein
MAASLATQLRPYRLLPLAAPAAGGPARAPSRHPGTLHQVESALLGLRRTHRRAVRIVQVGCGDGGWLIAAAQRAAALGFLAIEAHGFDRAPARIARARAAAAGLRDPRIGLSFATLAPDAGLAGEEEQSADIVLCPVTMQDRWSADLARITAGTLILVGDTQ